MVAVKEKEEHYEGFDFFLYSVCWDRMQVGVWTATVQLCSTLYFKLNDRRKVVDDRPPQLGMHAHAAASEDDSSSCSWPQHVGGHQRTGDSAGDSKTASSLVQSTGKFFNFLKCFAVKIKFWQNFN
jgi:hypothetical protein